MTVSRPPHITSKSKLLTSRGERREQLLVEMNYFPFAAAASLRTFAIVPSEKSLRFLFFWRRLGLVE
jgi:hypothetical protein